MTSPPRSVEVRVVLPEEIVGEEFSLSAEQIEECSRLIVDTVETLSLRRMLGVELGERERRSRARAEAVERIDWNKWKEEIDP